jgi:hypothetical protein
MTAQDTCSERKHQPGAPPTETILDGGQRMIGRYRARTAARRRARLISPRKRRTMVRWLRRTAGYDHEPHPFARRRETLLHYRVAAVRADLLEIAAMLERAPDPDPASVTALCDLLARGCDSPLYNSDIHISELIATLHYVGAGLGQSERAARP